MALDPLIDRETEMARLMQSWRAVVDGGARLVVVTGRRQVGKTFLLSHMEHRIQRDAETVYLTALPDVSRQTQLEAALRRLREQVDDPWLPDRLESWSALLRWLLTRASGRPLAVVIDEVPYLVDSDPGLLGEVQQVWDEVRRQADPPRLLLALTGSSVATMQAMTAASGALFGRPDDELVIHPFDLQTAAVVLSRLTPPAVIEAYALCGGYPYHLRSWDQAATVTDNLRRMMFTPGGLLLRNGLQMVSDLPDIGGHRRVLHAIGSGLHRRAEIEQAIGQRADRAFELLQRSGVVDHARPLGSPDRTPGLWRLTDPFIRAWHEFAWADQGQIEAGLGDGVMAARQGRWQRHIGTVFEEEARQHAIRLTRAGELPADARIGEWWTTRGQQVQIDVLGLLGKRTVIVGEARWNARPADDRVLEELRRKERAAPDPIAAPVLALWNRGGVADHLRSKIQSYTPADMVRSAASD